MTRRYATPFRLAAIAASIILGALPLTAHAAAPFTVVALPDTQNYCDSALGGTIFSSQTSWIVNNKVSQNIAFVTQEGDVTNNGNTNQYAYATAALYPLDSKVPWAVLPGNHDYGNITNYTNVLGPSHFTGQSWYGGSYQQSSWQTFTAGGRNYLNLSLQYQAPNDVLSWAQGVINNHLNWPTIVTTHDYMTEGSRTNYGDTLFNGPITAANGNPSNADGLVYGNQQVFMVLAGHMHYEYSPSEPGGPGTVTDKDGKQVFELLADYQNGDYGGNGGNGYMRLYQFDEDVNTIHVKTFSPYDSGGRYQTGSISQFDIPMNFNARLGAAPEPSTLALVGIGAISLLAFAWRRRKHSSVIA